jgi:hypothetical protein
MDWETLSVFPGKPNQKQHQQFLDIINDNSLTQVVNKTTRKDKTLDLILTNYPATVNKVETLPPIADHDVVYIEFITSTDLVGSIHMRILLDLTRFLYQL